MPPEDLRRQLKATFRWRTDRAQDTFKADVTGWWRDPDILASLGPAIADLYREEHPSLILGLQSRGSLLGSLVATHLRVGLIEVRKEPSPAADSDAWITTMTAPDYADRQWRLGFRRSLMADNERVLLVDDWVATGTQAAGAQRLVKTVGASWIGTAVVVDALTDHTTRRKLGVRSLLKEHDLAD